MFDMSVSVGQTDKSSYFETIGVLHLKHKCVKHRYDKPKYIHSDQKENKFASKTEKESRNINIQSETSRYM